MITKKISYKRQNYHFQILDPNWAHTLKHMPQNISHKNHISPEKLALIINNLNNGKTLDDISDFISISTRAIWRLLMQISRYEWTFKGFQKQCKLCNNSLKNKIIYAIDLEIYRKKLLEFNNSKKIYYNSKKHEKWKPFVRFYKKTCNEYIVNRNNNDIAKRTVKESVSNILFKFRSYSKANDNNTNCYIPNVSSVYKLFKSNPKYAFKIDILPILSVEKGKEQKTEKEM